MINVVAELQRIGWAYNYGGEDELRCICPFHADSSPSCAINVAKEAFRCCTAGCGAKGDFITFLAGALQTTRQTIKKDLSTRYDLTTDKTIDAHVIERYHHDLWQANVLLEALRVRGLTDDDLRKYRLGTKDGRVTIPVKNQAGMYVNIRSYLPGAPGADKFKNLKGRGSARLYPIDQLAYPKLMLVGGECKAIAAAAKLNPHGIGAITSTLGESNWDPKLTDLFTNKEVVVVYDVDEEGVKSQENTCKHLQRVCRVKSGVLPLDSVKFPKGDINDFVMARGDLLKVFTDAKAFVSSKRARLIKTKAKRVELSYAMTAPCAGTRVKLSATVSTLDMSPYIIPKTVQVTCPRDTDNCATCAVFLNKAEELYDIDPESPAILEMVAKPKIAQTIILKEELEIPRRCDVCEFVTTDFYNIEDVRISPRLEITNRTLDRSMQPAICIGTGVELNENYDLIGRMHPHPATQQSTLLISKYRTCQDALSSYKVKDREALKIFQPAEWTVKGLQDKLDHIYDDLEANVTQIWGRRVMHLYVDLAYHSPLFLMFEGREIKGWTEILIVGDSAQGKSETAINLQKHYGLGEKVESKNATVAGLLGGLQQLGTRWFVSWGVFPTHDKRLIISEELKGLSTEVIGRLTDMRSSGIAEIPKIEKRRTHARTRWLALSNPRSDYPIAHYNFGIECIKELIGGPEDVRRFDACLIVAANDVSHTLINESQEKRRKVPVTYTGKKCRDLILWGWVTNNVTIDQETTDIILKHANQLSTRFTNAIPIVDSGSMRYKLARLAAALAVRTYSANEAGGILVRPCHVDYIAEMLNTVYSSRTFGYLEYSESLNAAASLSREDELRRTLMAAPWPSELRVQMLGKIYLELQDIMDWCEWDRVQAQSLISLMVRSRALERRQRCYVKTPAFVTWLKALDMPERPSHLQGVEF